MTVVVVSFVILLFSWTRDNVYPLCHVQGRWRYWIVLTNPPFPIRNEGFLFRGWISGYSEGLFSVEKGGHARLLWSYFSILLLLPPFQQGYKGYFPSYPFPMEVLRILNIASSQLFPNSWGYIKAFKMVCEDVDATLTVVVFFLFLHHQTDKG